MLSCAVFGHRNLCAEKYKDKLKKIFTELIEVDGVTQFYCGARGNFDWCCIEVIDGLKRIYPQIKLTLVLSYRFEKPDSGYILPKCFDDSVYLLEEEVPKRFAISATNRRLAEIVDFVVAGCVTHAGGAYEACKHAKRKNKRIISVVEGWEV